jgi:hypothetical protein
MNPKAKGEITEAVILAELMKRGKVVLLPFGNNQRYDLLIDDGGTFTRVQCKTGRLINHCVRFYTRSVNGFTGKKRGYRGEIDLFMVYCPDNQKIYAINVNDAPESEMYLRIHPSRNGQRVGVFFASDYEY